eukprot:TRINITY_DN19507_c0_g1_i1.p1 TRINITY_DN19507_c0_g1~~TRINITY_DN19507_c0_g1_i1.p1  ORF type:complete len:294 (-),score=44.71 TRINITY_DN19507_c0_g1_i1:336-1217(-)
MASTFRPATKLLIPCGLLGDQHESNRQGGKPTSFDIKENIKGKYCISKSYKVLRMKDGVLKQFLSSVDSDSGFKGDLIQEAEWMSYVRSFSAPIQSSPSPKQLQESLEKQEFYVNFGYAIRVLKEELPAIFYKAPTLDIYRDDIVFKDPVNKFVGIKSYKSILWALRFHGKMFFKDLRVDILRIWHPAENVIMVRWTVKGIPRIPWNSRGHFDGTSEYKLDRKGKIYEHKVDNVALIPPSKVDLRVVETLISVLACPTPPISNYSESVSYILCNFFVPADVPVHRILETEQMC